jgi:hypothetical protein
VFSLLEKDASKPVGNWFQLTRTKKTFPAGDDVIKRSLEIVAARIEDLTLEKEASEGMS